MRYVHIFEFAVLILLLTGCSLPEKATPQVPTPSSIPSPEARFDPVPYRLLWYLNNEGEQTALLPDTEITLTFEEKRIGGSAGCNRYSADVQIVGSQLQIGDIEITLMACQEALMKQEAAYLKALESVVRYVMSGDELRLLNADGIEVLSFTKMEPRPLAGTGWTLTAYDAGKRGFTNVLTGSLVTAIFEEDGTLTGSTGCNSYSASYHVDGGWIHISSLSSTRKHCGAPGGLMDQETAYLQALGKAARYAIEGEMLHLYDEQGSRLAEFEANQ